MNGNRERLAWAILLAGFIVFLLVLISIPLGLNSVRQNAVRPLIIRVQANQGTVAVDDENDNRSAVFADDLAREFDPPLNVFTGATDSGVVLFSLPDDAGVVAWVQSYSNTNLQIKQAQTPRFSSSDRLHGIILQLDQGRLRLTIPDPLIRTVYLEVQTPQGVVLINQPGQYAVEVANIETSVVVLKGAVAMQAQENTLMLQADQRGIMPLDGVPTGPFPTERNLLSNGDFSDSLTDWSPLAWNIEIPDQPEGEVTPGFISNEPSLRFYRLGTGHADVTVRQSLDQDVTDFTVLRLETTMIIHGQDVAVCGVRGSECPLTIRLEYLDQNGNMQVWQQGFYAVGEIVPGQTPDICVSCAVVQSPHVDVSLNQLAFYELDILAELARQGYLPPSRLKSVSLISAGHSFEVEVVNVGLFGKE